MDLLAIINLAKAIAPLVPGAIVTSQHLIAAIKAVKPEAEVDDDLRSLINEALLAKAEADKAAAGEDVR